MKKKLIELIVRYAHRYAESLQPLQEDGYHNLMIDMVNWSKEWNDYYTHMHHDAFIYTESRLFGYVFYSDDEGNCEIRKDESNRQAVVRVYRLTTKRGGAWVGLPTKSLRSTMEPTLVELQNQYPKGTKFINYNA